MSLHPRPSVPPWTPLAVVAGLLLLAVPALAQSTEVTVTRDDGSAPYAYEPDLVEIAVGGSVTWTNPHVHLTGAAADHPTNCRQGQSAGQCPWSSEPLPPGGSFTVEFPDEGTFVYFCAVHPYMEGTVVVGDGDPGSPQPQPTSEPDPQPDPGPEPPQDDGTDHPSPDDGAASDQPQDDAPPTGSATTERPPPSTTGGAAVDAGDPSGDQDTTGQAADDRAGSHNPLAQAPSPGRPADGEPEADAETAPFDEDDEGNEFVYALAALLVVGSALAVARAIRDR